MADNNGTTTEGPDKPESGLSSNLKIALIVAAIVFFWLIIVILAVCWCRNKSAKNDRSSKVKKRKENSDEEKMIGMRKKKAGKKNESSTSAGSVSIEEKVPVSYVNQSIDDAGRTLSFSMAKAMEDAMRKTVESYVINANRLELKEVIGSGGFGMVHKGILSDKNLQNPKIVAVKTVHAEKCSQESITKFIQEVMLMKGFMHKNVLTMTGMVLRENIPYVILPFMENGDLKTYLGKTDRDFLVKDLLGMGVQVANGMAYLAEQNFVHRDLAARNCMVDKNQVIKVADFGLSRDIFCDDYYVMEEMNTPLPIKWMAVESIKEGVFSKKSDVWSFAVLLWEIITRGQNPYSGLSNVEVIKYVTQGNRLTEPAYSPPGVYAIMNRCWSEDSGRRPSFAQISKELQEMLTTGKKEKDASKGRKDKKQYYNVNKTKQRK